VPDAEGLSDDEMQVIAREMKCSETAFVLPPSALGAYLVLNRLVSVSAATLIRAEQGHILRRPSEILVESEVDPASLDGQGRRGFARSGSAGEDGGSGHRPGAFGALGVASTST
jgi:predicted PhzF superfamily epimerase YddE/YHI9